jgi:hypothetical protein
MVRTTFTVFLLAMVGCAGAPPEPRADPLAAAREEQIARLAEYRRAGMYPVDEQGMPISVFRDADGRPCPMAYLIEQSGRRDLVDQVVREDNTLRLRDVNDGPLLAWMETSGLTRDEIDLVQGVMEWDLSQMIIEENKDGTVTVHQARRSVDANLDRVLTQLRAGVSREPRTGD